VPEEPVKKRGLSSEAGESEGTQGMLGERRWQPEKGGGGVVSRTHLLTKERNEASAEPSIAMIEVALYQRTSLPNQRKVFLEVRALSDPGAGYTNV